MTYEKSKSTQERVLNMVEHSFNQMQPHRHLGSQTEHSKKSSYLETSDEMREERKQSKTSLTVTNRKEEQEIQNEGGDSD